MNEEDVPREGKEVEPKPKTRYYQSDPMSMNLIEVSVNVSAGKR